MTAPLLLAVAGFLAGMVNSLAGGGTLISFPALVWLGRDPILANATSAVALWPGSLGGAYGFRSQLSDSKPLLRALVPPSIVGGLLGGWLLLRTDPKTFEALIPWLILIATGLLAVQERVSRWLQARPRRGGVAGIVLLQMAVGVYGGYFGAGIGILMLAVLGFLGEENIHRMNGLKNILACCINGVAAAAFIANGAVLWKDVAVLALASWAGGYFGAGLAFRLGKSAMRRLVITVGLALALTSLAKQYSH